MTKAARSGGFLAIFFGLLAGAAMPDVVAAQQGTWSTKAPMPTARVDTNAVVLDGKIYVIGGTLGKEPFTANEEYDPATDRWRSRAPMPRGIHHQGLAVVSGKIYAFGGFNLPAHGGPVDVAFEYDPKADTWRSLPKLSSLRASPSAVALDGKIHIIGGRGPDAVTVPTHEVFDPSTEQYSVRAPLPKGRDHAGLVVVDGKIHAIGGRLLGPDTNQGFHDVYDPATDAWTPAAPLPTARSSFGLTEYRGMILVVGGENEIMGPAGAHKVGLRHQDRPVGEARAATRGTARHGSWGGGSGDLLRRRRHHARPPRRDQRVAGVYAAVALLGPPHGSRDVAFPTNADRGDTPKILQPATAGGRLQLRTRLLRGSTSEFTRSPIRTSEPKKAVSHDRGIRRDASRDRDRDDAR